MGTAGNDRPEHSSVHRAAFAGLGGLTVRVVDSPHGLHRNTSVSSPNARLIVVKSVIGFPHTGQINSATDAVFSVGAKFLVIQTLSAG
jgi:hypothetical protein